MKIIITGSAGYIGSCLVSALEKKYEILGIDIVKPKFKQKNFIRCDLNKLKKTKSIFKKFKPDIIFHLAGQSTIDGINKKRDYLFNNYYVTKKIVDITKSLNIKYFIFSSTAAVYNQSNKLIDEKTKLKPNNIYGKTKLSCEKLIQTKLKAEQKFIIFRFFNVCSSLKRYNCGEMHDPETHLIPIIIKKYFDNDNVRVYGRSYKTRDGSCVRDYIHIKDIIRAFEKGLIYLKKKHRSQIINLGTGKGYSVLEILGAINKEIYPSKLKFNFFKKRKGDIANLVCKNILAKKLLSWKPINSSLRNIIRDEIYWQKFLKKNKIFRNSIY
jgi:UDP-glucose 4-epimerase